MCVQKVAGASSDRWRQCVKEDPPQVDGTVSRFFCVTLLSQDQPLLDRGACRLQASGDSTGGRAWSRMTTTSIRARCVGRPSSIAEWCTVSVSSVQDTICQDTFHKTQSVQDTICQDTFHKTQSVQDTFHDA